MMRSRISRSRLRGASFRQRGSVVINFALALGVILVVLAGTELGLLFYQKRELQKSVDLAALAAAQQVDANCFAARSAAVLSADGSGPTDPVRNLPSGFSLVSDGVIECGYWNPTVAADDHFRIEALSTNNAVRISIEKSPPALIPFFDGARRISVKAVAARTAPAASFSVGSKLLTNNASAPLMSILRFVGVDVDSLCVACYDGLAALKVTPRGLLEALNIPVTADLTVGGLNSLLTAEQVSVGQIVNVIANLAGSSDVLSANASLLAELTRVGVGVEDLLVHLGSDGAQNGGGRGLFAQISSLSADAALDVEVDALQLLTAAVGVGVSKNAVSLDTGSSPLGIDLQARIIEPPSVGIGGVGTTAYNSQVRVVAKIDSSSSVLSGILGTLGTSINLPIVIDVVNARGELTAIDCEATPPRATIEVNSPILSACVGQVDPSLLWSKADVCTSGDLQEMNFVRLLGINLLSGKVQVDALEHTQSLILDAGESETTTRNNLEIGDTVNDLTEELLKLVLGGSSTGSEPADRASTPEIAAALADRYLVNAGASGATVSSIQLTTIRSYLEAGNMTWNRPALLGLLSEPMPTAWEDNVRQLIGGCRSGSAFTRSCVRERLITFLQTPNVEGLLSGLIGGLLDLVSGLLGLDADEPGTPLLSALLGPIIELLRPVLNAVGNSVSGLLGDALGLELGKTDVHLNSVSCRNSRLVY